ncbi:unnamed protein product [Brachionus calyciflorus]|uniref:Nuclear receptor domain-containing protein n=1 Tax=Brachionus calyciflorus TaxID=104777 RepID=A0A813VZY6_9BILA|nr:unnamed protein product [Brachionus calyciflorus]
MPLILEKYIPDDNSYLTHGKCRICLERANSINFGVFCCKACKAFFMRSSINKYKKYECKFNQACLNDSEKIKKCKFCRWDKCLKNGMSINEDRPIKLRNSPKKFTQTNPSVSLESKQNIISKQADSFNCEYYVKSDQTRLLILNQLKEITCELYRENTREFSSSVLIANYIANSCQKRFYNYTEEFNQFIREERFKVFQKHSNSIVTILKDLPCFLNISKNDLKTMISTQFFPTLSVMYLKFFINDDYYFMFDNDVQLNRDVFAALYNVKARDYAFDYLFTMKSLDMSEKELGLLIPFFLCLTSY